MRCSALLLCAVVVVNWAAAQSPRYGSTQLAGARYLIVQQLLHDTNGLDELVFLSADAGKLSVVWQDHSNAAYVRHFDEWGMPLHTPTRIDDPSADQDDWPICSAFRENQTCAFWNNSSYPFSGGIWFSSGVEAIPVFEIAGAFGATSAALRNGLTSFAETYLVSGSNADTFIHVFRLDGTRLGDRIGFTETTRREQSPSIAFLSDSTLIAGYIRSGLTPESRPRIVARRIESDLSVGDFVELYPLNVQTKLVVRALPNDDFLAISDRFPAGDGGVAVRCDAHCTPIGDPIPLHAGWRGAAANSQAQIALAFNRLPIDWYLRLYGTDGAPIGDEWRPVIPPVNGQLKLTWPQPVAFDDNGTIWVAWYENGGFSRPIITMLRPFLPGDMNRDGLLNNFDIDPFVFALSNLPAYAESYDIPEDAAVIIGDINEDGFLNNFDIDPFVMLLAGE